MSVTKHQKCIFDTAQEKQTANCIRHQSKHYADSSKSEKTAPPADHNMMMHVPGDPAKLDWCVRVCVCVDAPSLCTYDVDFSVCVSEITKSLIKTK